MLDMLRWLPATQTHAESTHAVRYYPVRHQPPPPPIANPMVEYRFHPAMPFSVTVGDITIRPGESKWMPRSHARAVNDLLRSKHPEIVLTNTKGPTRIAPAAAECMRSEIALAGGREVCFACTVDSGGVQTARVVARGNGGQVLGLPGFFQRGQLLVHNHPNGVLEPSEADMECAAALYAKGIGFAITNNDASDIYIVVEPPRDQ